ncbi:MAG: peptidylprolyl isomerase [Kangiellaceae bacterium]|nr:peptidylprolyl isomerase [Kangiellaceae bacterium]
MKTLNQLKKRLTIIFLFPIIISFPSVNATIVQFETNMGNFEVNLYDNDTPLTVANFLQYVNDGDYSNIIFHRAPNPDFILQGGGFDTSLNAINTNPAVNNEPIYSNVRATIAMAKQATNPNSATNQWFINITNNSNNLDNQNEGFTVFGQVINDGMLIVDSIMNVSIFDLGGAFTQIPLQNFTAGNTPDDTNLIIISSIQVIDATVDTTTGLTRPLSTKTTAPTSSGGGGALSNLLLILLFGRVFKKRA